MDSWRCGHRGIHQKIKGAKQRGKKKQQEKGLISKLAKEPWFVISGVPLVIHYSTSSSNQKSSPSLNRLGLYLSYCYFALSSFSFTVWRRGLLLWWWLGNQGASWLTVFDWWGWRKTKHSPVLLDPTRHTLTFRRLPTRSASLRTPTSSSLYTFSLLPLSEPAVVIPVLLPSRFNAATSSSCSPFVIFLLPQVLVVWPLLGSLATAVARQL